MASSRTYGGSPHTVLSCHSPDTVRRDLLDEDSAESSGSARNGRRCAWSRWASVDNSDGAGLPVGGGEEEREDEDEVDEEGGEVLRLTLGPKPASALMTVLRWSRSAVM